MSASRHYYYTYEIIKRDKARSKGHGRIEVVDGGAFPLALVLGGLQEKPSWDPMVTFIHEIDEHQSEQLGLHIQSSESYKKLPADEDN